VRTVQIQKINTRSQTQSPVLDGEAGKRT